MAIDVSNFIMPADKYEGLYQIANTLERRGERKYEMDYRHQKDMEADQWKKLNLVQDLTDLSKYQTGSDVANAVGNKLMSDVYQKYTTNADKMSPIELQANIQKDMSGIIGGMETTKNELANLDKQMVALKTAYPGLNTAALYDDARKDVVHRRLRDDLGGFKNEMEVQPSQLDLNDPETLSHYVTGDKNLRTYFQNPQGLDQSEVYTGNRNNYTKFSAKIPAWKKPNFKPEDVEGGFLKKGQPGLSFKSSTLPTDVMPNSKNAPFEMIDEDVFNQLGGNEKMELIAATRNQVPGYDKMNPTEKEYAQRHIYLKTAKSLDQLDFHPTDIHTPSASMLKFYAGDSGKKPQEPIDLRDPIYKDVDGGKDITPLMQGVKVTGLPNGTSLLARSVVFDPQTKKVTYQEYTDKKDEEGNFPKKTVNLTTFLQNIKTNNPGIDMKFLEGLWNPITNNEQPKQPGMGKTPTTRTPKKDPLGILE